MLDDEPKMANIGTLVNPVTLSWNVPLTLQVIPFFFFLTLQVTGNALLGRYCHFKEL